MTTTEPSTRRARRTIPARTGILRPAATPARTALVAAIAVVVVVAGAIFLASSTVDAGLSHAANELHTGAIGAVTTLVYLVFSPVPALLITVVCTALVWVCSRDVRPAAAFAVVIAVTWLPTALIKLVADRPRPHDLPYPFHPAQIDASYPSGHAAFIVAACLALWFVLRDTRWRTVAGIGAVIVPVVVLCSLVIDGVHYPTDVLASTVWSLGVAPFVRVAWVRWGAPVVPFLR